MEIELAGNRAALLPEKALYFPEIKTLVVADVHWGKAGHFRKHGMAIPGRMSGGNGERLAYLIQKTGADTVVFAGDLFHSRHNNEVAAFADWRAGFPEIKFQLVIGNHDILTEDFYTACELELFPENLSLGNFRIYHDAPAESDDFVIHGHIHPGIKLSGRGRQQIALPCFAWSQNTLILPAFGDFTGCFYVDACDFKAIYAVAEREVIRVK